MIYKEIEYKYSAQDINMETFDESMSLLSNNVPGVLVSSHDDFFIQESSITIGKVDFIRYRYNDYVQELTLKKKTCLKNNTNRVEINLNMNETDRDKVGSFLKNIGFNFSFRIYKTSKIYHIDNVIIAYYIVYNDNFKEIGRFIEIEANEHHNWDSEEVAFATINFFESQLQSLNLNSSMRLSQSLFEMFCPKNVI